MTERELIERYKAEHPELKVIAPQAGFQERFIRSSCDVTFGGGVLAPQPLTSSVLTPHGFVRFSDIKTGDIVMDIDRTLQKVTHVDRYGLHECIRIVLEDGSSAECSLSHRWWIYRQGKGESEAVSFELLEAFQIARDKHQPSGIMFFRYVDGEVQKVALKEIIEIGQHEVACIGVSGEHETYVTDDYIITKNCGKAQPNAAKILTPKGWKRLGELKVGDIISAPNGKTQTVERIYEKGERRLYRIMTPNGMTRACAEHLWHMYHKPTKQFVTVSTEEMYNTGASNYAFPLPEPFEFAPIRDKEPLPIEPYALGRILALGLKDERINASYRIRLAQIGITNEPFVPTRYKWGSIEERTQLLTGFFDSLNITADANHRIVVKDLLQERLTRDMIWVALSMGGSAIPKRENLVKAFKLIFMFPDITKYVTKLKGKRTKEKEVFFRDVKVIQRLSMKKLCRCILVSDPSHLYVTDDFLLTHNTFAAILMVAEPTLDPAFRAAFTRRNLGNLKQGGGIVDDFRAAYGDYVHITTSDNPRVTFPSGSYVDCLHIANEEPTALTERAKGWQYDLFYMDELTSYEFSTFSIIGTRSRGKGAFTGKIRGTTNPKKSHWIRQMISYYIGVDGFIDPTRDGRVTYYYQAGETVNDVCHGINKEEVYAQCSIDIDRKLSRLGGEDWDYRNLIRSMCFYAGKMAENKAIIGSNANYIGAVAAVGGRRAQQQIEGNWNVDEDEDIKLPIKSSDAQAVFTNDPCTNGDHWITVDLADVGTDNVIALAWDGFHIVDAMIIESSTPRMNYERIKIFALKHSIPDPHVIYDATRATYMYDYMPEAIPFISSSTSRGKYALQADRLKDECYLRLVRVISTGMMSMAEEVAKSEYKHQNLKQKITFQVEFLEECSVVKFREKANGKQKLLSKKEMNANLGKNRSMDLLDPCAMRMLPILKYQYGEELDETSPLKRRESDSRGDGSFDIYSEENWC